MRGREHLLNLADLTSFPLPSVPLCKNNASQFPSGEEFRRWKELGIKACLFIMAPGPTWSPLLSSLVLKQLCELDVEGATDLPLQIKTLSPSQPEGLAQAQDGHKYTQDVSLMPVLVPKNPALEYYGHGSSITAREPTVIFSRIQRGLLTIVESVQAEDMAYDRPSWHCSSPIQKHRTAEAQSTQSWQIQTCILIRFWVTHVCM